MKKRLFIAINFDNATKLALAKIIARLPSLSVINKTKIDKLHLTLKFLGNMEENLIPKIQTILNDVVMKYSPLQLLFTQIGIFPNWEQPNVIWIGINGTHLRELQRDIVQQLFKVVPTVDIKLFKPHLTLARIKYPLTLDQLACLRSLQNEISLSAIPIATAISVDLMESTLISGGAIYATISCHLFTK